MFRKKLPSTKNECLIYFSNKINKSEKPSNCFSNKELAYFYKMFFGVAPSKYLEYHQLLSSIEDYISKEERSATKE